MDAQVSAVAAEEIPDDRIVRTIIKIRERIAEVNREYEARLKVFEEQKHQLEVEILKRLQARGATQTKTDAGTCFITEDVKFTIADEDAYGAFVLAQQDYEFYQKRAKVEHVQAWMKDNEGKLPPGLTSFRELKINTRAPSRRTKDKGNG